MLSNKNEAWIKQNVVPELRGLIKYKGAPNLDLGEKRRLPGISDS